MKIKPQEVENNIASEHYFTAFEGVLGAYRNNNDMHPIGGSPDADETEKLKSLTICVLTLRNGFTVTGESAPINPNNFDPKIGRQVARRRAVDKIWPLMGYAALRESKAREGKA